MTPISGRSRLMLVTLITLAWGGYTFMQRAPVADSDAPAPGAGEYDSVTRSHEIETETAAPRGPSSAPVWTRLGRGGTLASALERVGLASELRPSFLECAGRFLDLRRLPPETGILASIDEGRQVVALRADPGRFLRVTWPRHRRSAAPRAELIRLPVITSLETTGGVVQSSVAQALADAPHGLQLTHAFADVFQWDVDLLVDPRPGDSVRIVYEVRRLGALPDHLPPFGDAPSNPGEFLEVGRILAASYEGRMARSTGFWVEDSVGIGSYFDGEGQPLRKAFLKSPLNYRRITSRFSNARRHPVTRRVVPHHGIDFAAASGTPVVATSDGRVVAVGWEGALGRAVRIRHGSSYVTVYGHLRGFARGIERGVEVRQNQVIGYVGSTGRATGPHLHYTLLASGRPIDPFRFKNPPADPLPPEGLPLLAEAKRRWLPVMHSIRLDDQRLASSDGVAHPVQPGA